MSILVHNIDSGRIGWVLLQSFHIKEIEKPLPFRECTCFVSDTVDALGYLYAFLCINIWFCSWTDFTLFVYVGFRASVQTLCWKRNCFLGFNC